MNPLIVALDFDSDIKALALADQLDPQDCALKVGHELFTRYGPQLVRSLMDRQFRIFLDLKFHDIPNTVSRACAACADLGVWMMNVHALAGSAAMESARRALEPYGDERPLLIAVTVLTSMNEFDLSAVNLNSSPERQVELLAQLALASGLDGVVCSAHEVPNIKSLCGTDFVTVTPGIRLPGNAMDDQKRIVTPAMARQLGSDYWVVGRPITRSDNPLEVIHAILHSK